MNEYDNRYCDRCTFVTPDEMPRLEDKHPDITAMTPYQYLCPVCFHQVAREIAEGKWRINPPGSLRVLNFASGD